MLYINCGWKSDAIMPMLTVFLNICALYPTYEKYMYIFAVHSELLENSEIQRNEHRGIFGITQMVECSAHKQLKVEH